MADVAVSTATLATHEVHDGLWGPFWISTTTGYVFVQGVGATDRGTLTAYKTTDRGASYAAVAVVDQGNDNFTSWACWFEAMTPGRTASLVHVAVINDIGASSVVTYYLFTPGADTFSAGDEVVAGLNGTVNTAATLDITITVAVSGEIYIFGRDDVTTSFGFRSSDGDTWSSINNPYEGAQDTCKAYPANLADTDDIWALFNDADTDELDLKTYDASGDSWSTVNIGASAESDAGGYKAQYNGYPRRSDGHLLVAAWTAFDTAGADLLTWDITDAGTITAKTNLATDVTESVMIDLLIDPFRDHVYAGYLGKSDGTEAWASLVTVFYKLSTDGMGTWSADTTYSESTDDFRGISAGAVHPLNGGRWEPAFFDDDDVDIYVNFVNSVEIRAQGGGSGGGKGKGPGGGGGNDPGKPGKKGNPPGQRAGNIVANSWRWKR